MRSVSFACLAFLFATVSCAPGARAAAEPDRDDLIKAEVLLDRAHFSPGAIDGSFGRNLHNAIAAYEAAHDLPVDGELTAAVWDSLSADDGPVLTTYVIEPADVRGPFLRYVPAGFSAEAKLKRLSYTSPVQLISQKFHMSQGLLRELNPDADFHRAGQSITVAATGRSDLGAMVARVEVDKAHNTVRAFDAQNNLIADYPATVGSDDRPSPTGTYEVRGVQWNPVYHYDPRVLTFGHINHKLSIMPGPNNPVGVVWIELSKPNYGIHGAPDPEKIGKTSSHGCVRLTNWDATQLAHAVTPGTTVAFVNGEGSR
jgi:lipoprotein-anchoring transpeptidase ErfK/SrfK